MRTKRARRWRSVLFQRSTWAVSPVSFPTAERCSEGDHRRVRCPERRFAVSLPIPFRNRFPQSLARPLAPIPHCIGDHLSRLTAQGNPNPGVVGFFEHKRPQFVQFQRGGSGILGIRGDQGGT